MTRLSRWKMACGVFVLYGAAAIPSPAQTFTSLTAFDINDGANPWYAPLAQGVDGNFYGTTAYGGSTYNNEFACGFEEGCGTIFTVTPTGRVTPLYNLCGSGDCSRDGSHPTAGLFLATDGNFYGTTNGADYGTVFKITIAGALTTLHFMCPQNPCSYGASPYAGVIQGSNGRFYGVTNGGGYKHCNNGAYGCGTLFEMAPAGTLTGIYRFCSKMNCPDGSFPYSGLIQATDGNFYGVTAGGGANDGGTVFKITPNGRLTTLYSFCSQPGCSDGADPWGGSLIQATDGNFYGTTVTGGANTSCNGGGCGTIFRITPTGTLTTLYSFCSQPNCVDGSGPVASLVQGTDGNFYGTTGSGGTDLTDCRSTFSVSGCGTVFQMTLGGTLTTLHSFSNTDGAEPQAALLQATSGIFYGTTTFGGNLECLGNSVACGTIFSLNMGLGPFVSLVRNPAKVGQTFGIFRPRIHRNHRRLTQRNPGDLHSRVRHIIGSHGSPRSHHRLRNRDHAQRHANQQRTLPGGQVSPASN